MDMDKLRERIARQIDPLGGSSYVSEDYARAAAVSRADALKRADAVIADLGLTVLPIEHGRSGRFTVNVLGEWEEER